MKRITARYQGSANFDFSDFFLPRVFCIRSPFVHFQMKLYACALDCETGFTNFFDEVRSALNGHDREPLFTNLCDDLSIIISSYYRNRNDNA